MTGFKGTTLTLTCAFAVLLSACGSSNSSTTGALGVAASGGQAGSGAGGGNSGHGGGGSGGGSSGAGGLQPGMGVFPASSPFYQDISQAPLDSQSATILSALQSTGWGGNRDTIGIDFSFNINVADDSVVPRPFQPSADFYTGDCDTAPVPLPVGGKGEGVDDYACTGGDCHLFIYTTTRYYELYQSDVTGGMATGGTFTATCLALWDLTRDYWVPAAVPNFSRGDGCTGGDAADLPMAPLVLTKEELMAGSVKHALRFTIDNSRIASGIYVHPATHLGGPSGDPATTLPYGARLRLRGNFDLASLPNDYARTVAKALQTYGMYLADGGNIYVSATVDASDLISNSILGSIQASDLEMVDGGTRINSSDVNCPHVPISQ